MFDKKEERDPFEFFGDLDHVETEAAEEDLDAHHDDEVVAEPRVIEPKPPRRKVSGFSWAGFAGGLAAFTWIGAAIGGPLSYFGMDAIMTMDPAMQAGLVALAFGPALLFWVSASAAGEALKARRLADELTRIARETPLTATEADARRIANTVKAEVDSINNAVAAALDRLAELEHHAQRNAALFGDAIAHSCDSAEAMTGALQRERDAIVTLNGEMREETEAMAVSVGRQVRLMREASKLVTSEMSAAESAIEQHLTAFAQAGATLGDHTAAFHEAADGAHAAANELNGKVASMLDGLSEATRLTDAARQSAEDAVLAANETAQAVRETTRGAISDAKEAADMIRAETAAIQQAAAETLAKLTSGAQTARTSVKAAERTPLRVPAATRKASAPEKPQSLQVAANAAAARWAPRRDRPETEQRRGFKPFTGWNQFFAAARSEDMPKAANETGAYDLVDFENRDAALRHGAIDLMFAAGVDLHGVLGARDLARIADRSRHGASARRRAVADAAPSAVSRVARHVRRDGGAQSLAHEFRARPDLAKSADKNEGSDLVRAYLLIDAALA